MLKFNTVLQKFPAKFLGSMIGVKKLTEEMGVYLEKQMISKINKGNLGKARETNKSRGESMGQGNHEIHGQIKR